MKSIALTTSIYADNMNRICSELNVKIMLKTSMKIIFELNSYTISSNVLLIKFLALLIFNWMKNRLLSYSAAFIIMLRLKYKTILIV